MRNNCECGNGNCTGIVEQGPQGWLHTGSKI